MIAEGDKIEWIADLGPDGPQLGEIGTVRKIDPTGLAFLVDWPDDLVSIEIEKDRDNYWKVVD